MQLEEADLEYFRTMMVQTQATVGKQEESVVIGKAAEALAGARKSNPPSFVCHRLKHLDLLLLMLKDEEWRLSSQERANVLSTLAYFVEPADLIHDDIPVLGFIDDAIMIELVARELQHELAAYQDFCRYKEAFGDLEKGAGSPASKERWLVRKRNQLHARMRRRRTRMYQRENRRRTSRSGIRLF